MHLLDVVMGLAQRVEAMQQAPMGESVVASVSALALASAQTLELAVAPTAPEIRVMLAMREFYSLEPPIFQGQSDPVVAAEWLEQVTCALDTLLIYEEDLRVRFASFQLWGNARQWWKTVKVRVGMSWTDFRDISLERYVPETTRDSI